VFDATPTEPTDAEKLEVLRELLSNVSRAMLDLRVDVQRLYQKSRQADFVDSQITPTDLG
jgi:hypothetical protein